MTDPPDSAGTEHLVRVFIASTFRDMQAERDSLVKHIFPEPRRRCRARFHPELACPCLARRQAAGSFHGRTK